MSELSQSDLDFFNTMVGNDQVKVAVDLDMKTRAILGAESHPEHELDRVESEAFHHDNIASQPAPAIAPPMQSEGMLAPPMVDQADHEPPPDEEQLSAPEPSDEPVVSVAPDRSTHGKVFNSKGIHPLRLKRLLDFKYEGKWDEWEPETLWWAIRRDFGPVGEVTRNKIMALRVAMRTDLPWLDWDVFENSGVAWTDGIPVFGAFQPMAPSQVAFTIQVLHSIRVGETFENEVAAYMAATLETNGIVYAPEAWFPVEVQKLIDRKPWLAPLKADIAAAWSKVGQLRDPRAIDWNENSPVDLNVMKLLVIDNYLKKRAQEDRLDQFAEPTAPGQVVP